MRCASVQYQCVWTRECVNEECGDVTCVVSGGGGVVLGEWRGVVRCGNAWCCGDKCEACEADAVLACVRAGMGHQHREATTAVPRKPVRVLEVTLRSCWLAILLLLSPAPSNQPSSTHSRR